MNLKKASLKVASLALSISVLTVPFVSNASAATDSNIIAIGQGYLTIL
ncbi:hypothetical protein ACFVR2_20010 [Gottfriedia sp. NPDC057991]